MSPFAHTRNRFLISLTALGAFGALCAQAATAATLKVSPAKPVLEYAEVLETEGFGEVSGQDTLAAPVAPRTVQAQASAPAVTAAPTELMAASRATGRSMVVKATAYNSLANQTDSTPHVTATGTRTRPGVIALSRDLLRTFPYGTRVTLQDLSGRYNFAGRVFVVEDTMHVRKFNQVDIWMPTYNEAMRFGTSQVRITALR